MAGVKELLIVLAILSSVSSRHRRKFPRPWLEDPEENEIPGASGGEVCDSNDCRQISSLFSESMNLSADPCKNFYEFSCGNWVAKKKIPPYEPSWSHYRVFYYTLQQRIRDTLQSEPSPEDILPVRQAKKWFRSCMDSETREARGIRPLESIIMQNGGWPMIMDAEEWNDDDLSWQEIEANYARLMGEFTFYDIIPSRQMRDDDSQGKILIATPDIPLMKNIPVENRNYTAGAIYEQTLRSVVQLFIDHTKADVSEEQLENDITNLLKFEKSISEAFKGKPWKSKDTAGEEDLDDDSSLDSLVEWWNARAKSMKEPEAQIDWRSVIQQFFDITNTKINGDVTISISEKRYFLLLRRILRSTDKRTIVNYIHWKFVSRYMGYTTKKLEEIIFNLAKNEIGITARPPKWFECVEKMEMTNAAAYAFVNKYYQEKTAKAATEMMKNIKAELKHQIKSAEWLTPEARESALEKLENMKTLMGFPDWYKNTTAVVNYYKGLTIGNELLDNVLSYDRYEKKLAIRKFLGYKDPDTWHLNALALNAVYRFDINTLDVPAADFQPPIFGHNVPDYVNYGIAGGVVGHEMGHGFDDTGVKKAANAKEPLLDEAMLKMYFQRAQCIVDQYDNYYKGQTLPPVVQFHLKRENKLLSGEPSMSWLTLGENIADITGLQSVVNAYKKMRMIKKPNGELKLPGFEKFTDEQMFFISLGGTYCDVSTPQFDKLKAEAFDTHSPAEFRVIGSVSNTQEFANVFNCPKGSPMNPENKCTIWLKPGVAPKLKSKRSSRHHWFDNRNF
ncbi:neprilysin-1 [Fopius arisanus]|uniref:Neprilysin-1 n=1 Tax=Fopius arisanus TaxID=64838 RepID=A0A9R1U8D8_9HYME|nr:PREDICTED: neprilysin-1-like [Fopius arisanus]